LKRRGSLISRMRFNTVISIRRMEVNICVKVSLLIRKP